MNTLTISHTLQKSITALIEANPKLADSTKKQYIKTIRQYLDTGCNLTDVEALAQYAQNLNKSSRAFR